jgi:hypothetical protein
MNASAMIKGRPARGGVMLLKIVLGRLARIDGAAANSNLLFTRVLNLSFLRFLWFRRRCAPWFRRRCGAWFRGESSVALRMVLGGRVLRGWMLRRRICPLGDNLFKPAAARTTGEQRTQNPY